MKQETIANLTSYIIEPETTVDNVVILLHGYGADGQDLISIGDMWKQDLPSTVFISPNAPHQCEQSPYGYQWFSLLDFTKDAMRQKIANTHDGLSVYIDAILQKYNLTDDKLILSGFSQGCMMSLNTALLRPQPCAGVLGYSGLLVDHNLPKQSTNKNTPVHLIHGEDDNVVPVQEWINATSVLTDAGFKVSGYTTPGLPHGIDPQGIKSGLGFIKECFTK